MLLGTIPEELSVVRRAPLSVLAGVVGVVMNPVPRREDMSVTFALERSLLVLGVANAEEERQTQDHGHRDRDHNITKFLHDLTPFI